MATRKRSPADSIATTRVSGKDLGTERVRRARDRRCRKARIGGAVAPRPGRAASIRAEPGKSAAQLVRADQLDIEAGCVALRLVALEPRTVRSDRARCRRGRRAENSQVSPISSLDLLPLRVRAQRQREFVRMAPLQADIAEIDAARLAADRALLDHRDRMAALAQEIRRPGPDQAAADDRNVVVDRAHGAVYHCVRETYIGTHRRAP